VKEFASIQTTGINGNFPGLSGKLAKAISGMSNLNPAFCFALSGP
jgi:hypothetical protein